MAERLGRQIFISGALAGLAASFFFSWLMLTPLGFGASWDGIAPTVTAKLVFWAPPIALVVGCLVWFVRRSSLAASAVFLAAPGYQAANVLFATFVLR